ncbi:tyrosine-type recombinase/integrase [uncultured Anaerofustis sp.]|uniref:tyrosine-type recombinase/integrase n=1 Tax=uncultured Anaerofustis sp. TaxID=904996 RepID=UPI0025E5CF85|nr:tyrosine-type recombinase/integrase [uncultured Anaerofustis sp.]
MDARTNTAKWSKKYKKWRIKIQRDGVPKEFTCTTPGRKGQRICNAKADKWLSERTFNENTTLEHLSVSYLEKVKDLVGTSRYKNICSQFNKWILPYKGKKRFSKLEEDDLQDILDKMFKEGKAAKHISGVKGTIEDFLKFARKKNITRLIPEDLQINPKAKREKKDSLQPDDLYTLFNNNKTTYYGKEIRDPYIYIYRMYVVTGLRRGELIALEKEKDILNAPVIRYFNKKIINVNNDTFLRVNKSINEYGELTEGKTENAYRYEILPQLALDIIKDEENFLKENHVISKYLFPELNGNHLKPQYISSRFKKYAEYHKLSCDTLHELRHTFVSLNDDDIEDETMLEIIGHGNKKITKNYKHVVVDRLSKASNVIDERMQDVLEYGEKLKKCSNVWSLKK